MPTVQPPPPAADTLAVDQLEAERITNLSYKSLERAAKAGEPVGRIKCGRRVLYHRATLEKWLISKLTGNTAN